MLFLFKSSFGLNKILIFHQDQQFISNLAKIHLKDNSKDFLVCVIELKINVLPIDSVRNLASTVEYKNKQYTDVNFTS